MVQKAILQIDCSKGVKKSSSADSRFRTPNSVTAAAADRLKQGASAASQQTDGAQSRASVRDGMITVQYNPASIKYRAATSTQKTAEPDVGTDTRMVTSIPRKSTVDMSFELVFHSTGDGDDSVREQMELVMNMIYDSPTRNIKFAWGKLVIEGKLTGFSGEYNMFDASGRPISGRMSLTVRTETTAKQVDKTLNEIDKERKNKPAAQDKEGGERNETGVSAVKEKIL
ncbi:MAG: hypothetical protein K2L18_11935 [Acetatifactor sp.]|nr:hypothetical protein [Acetatifactor sp.]